MADAHKRRWVILAGLGSPLLLLIGGGLTVTGGWLVFRAAAPESANSLIERVTGTTMRQVVSRETSTAWDSEAPIRLLDAEPVTEAILSGEIFIENDPAFSSGVAADPPPPEEVQRRLAGDIAAFLRVRALADAEAYRSYMSARGYQLRPDDEWPETLDRLYEYSGHEGERPREWGTWEAFQEFFARDGGEGNADWLMAISSAPAAAKLRFATLTDERGAPHFTWREVPLDSPYRGSSASGAQPYFRPGVSRLDILRRDGKVLTGRILLPVQARGGHWTVLSMALYFEPRSARWFVEHMSIANAGNVDRPPVY